MFKNTENPRIVLRNNLKEIRISRNLSQEELAKKVGTTVKTISSIERGIFNPTAMLAFLLALMLDVQVTDLFYLDSSENITEDTEEHEIRRVKRNR